MDDTRLTETVVLGLSSQGLEVRAVPLRLARYLVVFEVYHEGTGLRLSEVLSDFRIIARDRMLYLGRAVIKNLVDTGLMVICEAALEDSWLETELLALDPGRNRVGEEFQNFFAQWQKLYCVRPEFKTLVADLQMFLADFRLWVDQAEVGIRAMPSGDRSDRERQLAGQIADAAFGTLDAMFDKFERVAGTIEPELRPGHEVYVRRQLHPLVLCSPFAFRSVQKPLGYAGDYEIVNMILRDPHEGGSLFAKVLNRWFVKQPPAQAHRNRIDYLTDQLVQQAMRVHRAGSTCRVFNVGCGPAGEVQRFLATSELSQFARITCLDFSEETLVYARETLEDLKRQHHRTMPLDFVRKSVVQLLKGRSKAAVGADDHAYDMVYCAGLFDYLPDNVCRQLIGIFQDRLAPGGIIIVTNVEPSNPIRHWLSYVLDWHLIYRNASQMLGLCPRSVDPENVRVVADRTGVNVFMEIRRPAA